MRFSIFLLIVTLLCGSVALAQPSAEIQWGYFEEDSYVQGEPVYFNVQVKNTGSTVLSGLWLNVDISDPNGINVREGWWQDIPTLWPGETYTTGYDYVWTVPSDATLGQYSATVGLRDSQMIYHIVYHIDDFAVIEANPAAEIIWGYVDKPSYDPGETVELNVKVKNTGNVTLNGLWLNVDIESPSGNNVVEGFWQNVPTLEPNETYTTGYDDVWDIPYGAQPGEYTVTVGLRDDSQIYDIKYHLDDFVVEEGSPDAEIQWGYVENEIYYEGETARLNVRVKNTGNTILNDLWLNVDISNPNGSNVREGWWKAIPSLYPDETYTTGYDDVWDVPYGAEPGEYSVTVGLRDGSNIYDIEYNIDQFEVVIEEGPFPIADGRIVFHRYSSYWNWDGELYMLHFSDSSLIEISENWNIDHTINAHFSPDGSKIVFMAVPEGSHSWESFDVYLWEIGTQNPRNLTENNGLPDEDPKFSPDGSRIVFKQWGDLKEMDLEGNITRVITSDSMTIEEWAPFYTTDGQEVLYTRGKGSNADIYIIDIQGSNNRPRENNTNLEEFYPVTRDESTFLYTRWVSSSNHNNQVYLGYFSGVDPQSLLFNSEDANDADPYPVGAEYVFFSSTRLSENSWDLYLAEIASGAVWSLDEFNTNSPLMELGACYSNAEPSATDDVYGRIPTSFYLSQNNPNPFNLITVLNYDIPRNSFVSLSIFNLAGQKIATLVHEKQAAGHKSVSWDASDYSSGIYFYRLTVGDYTKTYPMMLVK